MDEPAECSRIESNPSKSFDDQEEFLDYFNAEFLSSTQETQENNQDLAALKKYMKHRKTRCSTLNIAPQPPKFCEKESYLKKNTRDVHLMEKKIRKMEKSFQQQHKILNENSDVNSHTYLILLEKFSNLNTEEDEECLREIFAEISKHTHDKQ